MYHFGVITLFTWRGSKWMVIFVIQGLIIKETEDKIVMTMLVFSWDTEASWNIFPYSQNKHAITYNIYRPNNCTTASGTYVLFTTPCPSPCIFNYWKLFSMVFFTHFFWDKLQLWWGWSGGGKDHAPALIVNSPPTNQMHGKNIM